MTFLIVVGLVILALGFACFRIGKWAEGFLRDYIT